MKFPRDVSAQKLVKALKMIGYKPVRQTGSHIRITRIRKDEAHHITIPAHNPLKIGTLRSILKRISDHTGTTVNDLVEIITKTK
jgi:predicted RNA binding protein YcfA (HicA-like mRNA interferase family)